MFLKELIKAFKEADWSNIVGTSKEKSALGNTINRAELVQGFNNTTTQTLINIL